ncbi:uncharacterized protein LOC136077729 [Hydra vulgaris]|uniref:Uncharacterized protein LOC136077729 n=1 Tax=Hydra vulgaris TaxID=6087 RepID=A0ABM4BG70_HYDVU
MNKMLEEPFCWAIWNEDEDEDTSGVIPSNWVVTGSHVFWPPNNFLQVKHAFYGRREPDHTWKKFPLVKVKFLENMSFAMNYAVHISTGSPQIMKKSHQQRKK